MASKRRSGFRPPELRGALGTILRTTTDVVRDAIERGAREGRARLDGARTSRRRQDALSELGELILDLIRRGEIDLAELPEARELVRQLDEFDAEAPHPGHAEPGPLHAAAPRSRFDDRARRDREIDREIGHEIGDDGTVSSGATAAARSARPTTPARPRRDAETPSTRAPTTPMKALTKPDIDDLGAAASANPEADPPATPLADRPATRRSPLAHDPHRRGGISFDDDDLDDLNEYMHPDDVPPRDPPKDPGGGEA